MKISKKSQYGLRAMAELALYYEEGPFSARSVSKRQGIPLLYLEQIFNRLKRAGLVKTIRGPGGGYTLARKPAAIKVKDILEALEERNSLVDCLSGEDKGLCSRVEICATRKFWAKMSRQIAELLDSTTLQHLCEIPKSKKGATDNIRHHYLFQI